MPWSPAPRILRCSRAWPAAGSAEAAGLAQTAGGTRPHHAFLVSQLLAHVDDLDEAIQTVGGHLDEVMVPSTDELARLDTIRGINQRTASPSHPHPEREVDSTGGFSEQRPLSAATARRERAARAGYQL